MRVRHKPWAKDKLQENPEWVVQEPERHKGSWQDLFPDDQPLHIEVGSGKGRFITEMAKAYPSINFVGIEMNASIIVSILEKMEAEAIPNLRLLNADASDLTAFFADDEVSRIYLNFSDPWPKNRHEKRRLTYKSFLSRYKKVLDGNGELHLKTDNQGLFEYSLESFSAYGLILKNISLDLTKAEMSSNIQTEYEEKFSSKGYRIYRCEALFHNMKQKEHTGS